MEQTDYDAMRDAFEMAEVLEGYSKDKLEILIFDEEGNNGEVVRFEFNEDGELESVYKYEEQ